MSGPTINQLTTDEIDAVSFLIRGVRDRGKAQPWDHYDIVAVLRQIGHEPITEALPAALLAAADERAQLPITITWDKYRPKPDDHAAEVDRGPKCDRCGRSERMCRRVTEQHIQAGVPDAAHDFRPIDLDAVRRRYATNAGA